MSQPSLPLSDLQRWMQGVIVHHGPVAEAVATRRAQALVRADRIAEVIRPTAQLTPEERLGIYHAQYPLRMRDALASDYPGLQHFLGAPGFARFAADYVRAFPSRSYTLNRLSDHVPDFVRRRRGTQHRGFLLDLARLEQAMAEAFDAEETKKLGEAEVAAVPAEAWPRARLVPVPSLRLLELRYPASAYLDSLDDAAHEHPGPRRRDGWVAVYRRNYGVYRQELTRAGFALLRDLRAGRTLGAALAAAARRGGRPPAERQLFRWFREWVSAGMFARIEVRAASPRSPRRRPVRRG